MKKVYLAGGMSTEWRERIIKAHPEYTYYDPTSHGLVDPKEYTVQDLNWILDSDVIIAYLEDTNPYGYNMAFEYGVAFFMSSVKTQLEEQEFGFLILIDEKYGGNKATSMLKVCSDRFFDDFEEFLKWWEVGDETESGKEV